MNFIIINNNYVLLTKCSFRNIFITYFAVIGAIVWKKSYTRCFNVKRCLNVLITDLKWLLYLFLIYSWFYHALLCRFWICKFSIITKPTYWVIFPFFVWFCGSFDINFCSVLFKISQFALKRFLKIIYVYRIRNYFTNLHYHLLNIWKTFNPN